MSYYGENHDCVGQLKIDQTGYLLTHPPNLRRDKLLHIVKLMVNEFAYGASDKMKISDTGL